MSLPVLVAVVALGLTIVIGLVHLTGGSTPRASLNDGELHEIAEREWAGRTIVESALCRSGRAGLVRFSDGSFGLVAVMGIRIATRLIEDPVLLQNETTEHGAGLKIAGDAAWKPVTLQGVSLEEGRLQWT